MMIPPPEITRTSTVRVACDGTDGGALPLSLGHPRVWLQIDPDIGFKDCGYCDRRFVLIGGPVDAAPPTASPDADTPGQNADVSQRPGDTPV